MDFVINPPTVKKSIITENRKKKSPSQKRNSNYYAKFKTEHTTHSHAHLFPYELFPAIACVSRQRQRQRHPIAVAKIIDKTRFASLRAQLDSALLCSALLYSVPDSVVLMRRARAKRYRGPRLRRRSRQQRRRRVSNQFNASCSR